MKRIPVQSSNLVSIGYDESLKILEIEFHSGTIYQYDGVPRVEYEQLMNASSHGRYLNVNIKNKFPYKQIL